MLRLMTLNLNYYVNKHGDWTERRERIVETIQMAYPDIIALQAVSADQNCEAGQDQAIQLSEALGDYPHVVFQPDGNQKDGVQLGSAMLARLPIANVEALKLSRRPDGEDPFERVLLSACFELPSGPLHIFNAHFSWVKEQLEDNLAEALPFIQRPNNPAMLMGDFNAPAGQGLLYLLGEAGWVDAWKELHPGEPGPTFEAGQPTLRIDYMWSNAHLAPYIRDISILGAGPHHLSDHLGLISTLDF